MKKRLYWAHVYGPRAADFERVFGTTRVAITSPAPRFVNLPTFTEPQPAFDLDLEWVAEQGYRAQLVAFLAERFEIPPAEVDQELERAGVPILATDCLVEVDARRVA